MSNENNRLAAFLASNTLLLGIFKDLDNKISDLSDEGLTDSEIIIRLEEDLEPSVDKHWYMGFFMPLQTAFITSLANAFAEQGIQYYRYETQRDDRVRPSHQILQDNIYELNSVLGQEMLPPNDYGCRCYITPLTSSEVAGESVQ